jgi:glutathione synthase/RimK-type ligase-like ATP-grasp enzyme
MNVLVMSEKLQAAQACIQSLGRAGHAVFVTYSGEASPNAFSKFVKGRVLAVAEKDTIDSKARALEAIVLKKAIDVVVPIHDEDALVAAAARDRSRARGAFILPPTESVQIAASKIRTFRLAQELGIRTPRSTIADTVADIRSTVARDSLPIVLKLPTATAASGTFILKTLDQLEARLAKLPAGPYLVQELIAGTPLGITGFADKGHLIDSFAFQPLRDENQSGTPMYALSLSRRAPADILAQLCLRLNWSGGIDIDFVMDATGNLYLLEINPRFSGTLVFADKVGVDLAWYYAKAASGVEIPVVSREDVPEGVLFVSLFPNEVLAISSNPSLMQPKAHAVRQGRTVVDNLYPEDGPLTVAQLTRALFIAWNAPRR